jgi:hypothetical protein
MKFSNVDPETASAVYDMLWQPAAAGPGGPKGTPLKGGNPADYFGDEEEDGTFDPDSTYVWKGGAPNQGGYIPDMYTGSAAVRPRPPVNNGAQNPAGPSVHTGTQNAAGPSVRNGRNNTGRPRVNNGTQSPAAPSVQNGRQNSGGPRVNNGTLAPAAPSVHNGGQKAGKLRGNLAGQAQGRPPVRNEGQNTGKLRGSISGQTQGRPPVSSSRQGQAAPSRTPLTGEAAARLIGGHPVLTPPFTAMNDPCFSSIRPYAMSGRIMRGLQLHTISGIRTLEGYPLPPGNILLALFSKWLTEGSLRMDRKGQKTVLILAAPSIRPDSRTEYELVQSLFRQKDSRTLYDTDALRQWYQNHRDECASLSHRMASEGIQRMAGLSMIGFASESGEQPVLSRDGRGLYGCILNMNIMFSNLPAAMNKGLFTEEQVRELVIRAPLFLRQKAMLAFLAEHRELAKYNPALNSIGPLTSFLGSAFMSGGTPSGSPS